MMGHHNMNLISEIDKQEPEALDENYVSFVNYSFGILY